MRFTRGGFLKAGATAALVVGSADAGRALAGNPAADLAGSSIGKPGKGPDYLERETYLPHLGSDFRIGPLRTKLVQAKPMRSPGDSFSLVFHARKGSTLVPGIHRFEHPVLGTFDLAVNPVDRGVRGLDIEAVVNRIAIAGGPRG